jgi:hypothetical protein
MLCLDSNPGGGMSLLWLGRWVVPPQALLNRGD